MFATAVRIERDLGVPSVSLNALTGHRSCAPEDCGRQTTILPQGPAPGTGRLSGGGDLAPSGLVGSGGPAGVGPGGVPRPPRRTRRATLTAPGAPCALAAGSAVERD